MTIKPIDYGQRNLMVSLLRAVLKRMMFLVYPLEQGQRYQMVITMDVDNHGLQENFSDLVNVSDVQGRSI